MVTLAQFREITEGLPGDFEIRIEACFTPEGNKTASCFEMMYSKETKEVVLLPDSEARRKATKDSNKIKNKCSIK